jgi:hypothetical protein
MQHQQRKLQQGRHRLFEATTVMHVPFYISISPFYVLVSFAKTERKVWDLKRPISPPIDMAPTFTTLPDRVLDQIAAALPGAEDLCKPRLANPLLRKLDFQALHETLSPRVEGRGRPPWTGNSGASFICLAWQVAMCRLYSLACFGDEFRAHEQTEQTKSLGEEL